MIKLYDSKSLPNLVAFMSGILAVSLIVFNLIPVRNDLGFRLDLYLLFLFFAGIICKKLNGKIWHIFIWAFIGQYIYGSCFIKFQPFDIFNIIIYILGSIVSAFGASILLLFRKIRKKLSKQPKNNF